MKPFGRHRGVVVSAIKPHVVEQHNEHWHKGKARTLGLESSSLQIEQHEIRVNKKSIANRSKIDPILLARSSSWSSRDFCTDWQPPASSNHRYITMSPQDHGRERYLCSEQVTRHSLDRTKHQNRFTTDFSSPHGSETLVRRHGMNHGMLTYRLLKCREGAHVMGHRLIREVGEDTIHMFGPTRSEKRN